MPVNKTNCGCESTQVGRENNFFQPVVMLSASTKTIDMIFNLIYETLIVECAKKDTDTDTDILQGRQPSLLLLVPLRLKTPNVWMHLQKY